MELRHVAELLQVDVKTVRSLIADGVDMVGQTERLCLMAEVGKSKRLQVSEEALDAFLAVREEHSPGRYCPVGVRRELLVEARHKCGMCREDGFLEFHHLLEWSKLGHHDPAYMIAICPNCHTKCTRGSIDPRSQRMYKENLSRFPRGEAGFELRLEWGDLRAVIDALHSELPKGQHVAVPASRFDTGGVKVARKNELNEMSAGYFETIRQDHEPFFDQILEFLRSPLNSEVRDIYYEVVDEIRFKTARGLHEGVPIDEVLLNIYDQAVDSQADRLRPRRRTLNLLLSFMYVACDVGRKK